MEASWSDELERAARETAKEAAPRRPELAEVFDAHAPFVARALRCLGVHDGELADACQEVFLVVHRRLAEFEGRSSLRTWLYAICVRQAFRARRRSARRREEPMAHPPASEGDAATPQEELERRRALASAMEILDRLEEGKRVVFVLYEVEQLPMAEIAEAIGCPLQTAYSRLYAARRDVARAPEARWAMSDRLPIDGSAAAMEPELRAFIATLRDAGPDRAELARMRASVLAAAGGAGASIAAAATGKSSAGATTAATLGATAKGAVVIALLAAGTALPGDLGLPRGQLDATRAAEPASMSHVGPATVSAMPGASTMGAPPASHVGPTAPVGAREDAARPVATDARRAVGPAAAPEARRGVARGAQQPVEPGAELRVPQDAARGAQQPAEDPDMVFDVGEVDPGAPGGDEGPPSEELANALRLYAQGEHAAAASAVLPVLEGRTSDGRVGLARAQLAYARSLFHLGLYHASAVAFDEITAAGASHPYFDASLPWLAELADHLPEPTLVIAQVGRYQRAQLDRLDTEETRDRHQQLLYLLGRHHYGERRLGEAIALFRAIRPGSRYYVPARFFEGVSHVRERRARPGIAAFRAVIEAVDEGGVEDGDRMRDLAWLSLARLYYSAANSRGADDRVQTNARAIGNAVDAWNRVPVESEYWLDALFEQSWALFLAGEEERALGRIHALLTPYFEGAYYPEALVLRAVIFFQHCHLDEAEGVVSDFHRRYDPVMDGLRRTLANHPEPLDAFALLERVRGGRGRFDPRVRAVVADVFDDRELLRHLAEVESLRAEEARAAATELGPDLAARLGQELAVERALAQARTGEIAHGRLERAVDDLQQRMNEMDAVLLEIETERRTGPTPDPRGRGDLSIEADQEHMVWPFDGEVWRDEVPYYRQQVRNRCVR